jgi:hypothetical protein
MSRRKMALLSLLAGTLIVAVVASVASFTTFSALGVLLLPGMIVAALPLAQGIHSGAAIFYLVLAALGNILVYSAPPWLILQRKYSQRAN